MEYFSMTDELGNPLPLEYGERQVPGVPLGAEKKILPKTRIITNSLRRVESEDLRVKIRVPSSYLNTLSSLHGDGLSNINGIIFPYTPTFSVDLKADYSSTTPVHSNFSINFYKSSSISSITINGKFTVENSNDAAFYLSTTHLLKALTRMRFGLDADRGSPPPICRLDAYGEYMFKDVPVAITNFKIDLPDSVDYFSTAYNNRSVMVPTISTLSLTCLPMYSRNEMQQFSVDGYLKGQYKGII
jgi:hypothetical protein